MPLRKHLLKLGHEITEEEKRELTKKMSIELLTKLLKDSKEATPPSTPKHVETAKLSPTTRSYKTAT